MMVVVEGPDGSGKSTLIDTLRQQAHQYFIILRPSRAPTTREDMLRYMHWSRLKSPELTVVFDRHPGISEHIYGPIIRNFNRLREFDTPNGRRALLLGVHAIVYCRPLTPVIEANALKSFQMDGVKEKVGEIIEAYDDMMFELSKTFDVIRYDHNHDSVESVIKRIWGNVDTRSTRESVQTPSDLSSSVPGDRDNESGSGSSTSD